MEPKARPISLIIICFVVAAFFIGRCSADYENKEINIDLSGVDDRDSIIAVKDSMIGVLTEKINDRDTLIVSLTNKESIQRDSVFVNLNSVFEGANDSIRDVLIEEALNSLQ